jgi:hypothetical protein
MFISPKTYGVHKSADLKKKHISPDGSYGLFLNCGKKIGSVIHIITQLLLSLHTRIIYLDHHKQFI